MSWKNGFPSKASRSASSIRQVYRETDDTVEKIGVTKAKAYMDKADIILVVIDRSRPLSDEDKAILEDTKDKNVLVVLNKTDLMPVVTVKKILAGYGHPVLSLSAGTGDGLDSLKDKLLSLALSHADTAGSALLTNTRHIELVRQSRQALQRALDSIEAGMPVDCAVVDLRECLELWARSQAIRSTTIWSKKYSADSV